MDFLKKDYKTFIIVILFSICFISIGKGICNYKIDEKYDLDYYTAKVISVDKIVPLEIIDTNKQNKKIYFKAKILSGKYKNEIVDSIQTVDYNYSYQPKEVEDGDKIVITPPKTIDYDEIVTGEDALWIFSLQKTSNHLVILVVIFLLTIILIGKWKGISTIIALIITTLSILEVFIPAVLNGYNIYLLTIIICSFIIIASLLLINGYNKKTLCAIIGNISGIIICGIIAIIMEKTLHITGILSEDHVYLSLLNSSKPINMPAMIWSGIVIGSLGAIMDVAMSIASSMNELNEKMKNKSFKSMFISGMNIGKDAIGTMTNTLILAYIGCSMATVLLLFSYNRDLLYLFNIEMISAEVLQSIIGSIGILAAVPVTTLFSAWVFNRKEKLN